MYVKECPECNRRSYSADKNSWICPYCGENLDNVETIRTKN